MAQIKNPGVGTGMKFVNALVEEWKSTTADISAGSFVRFVGDYTGKARMPESDALLASSVGQAHNFDVVLLDDRYAFISCIDRVGADSKLVHALLSFNDWGVELVSTRTSVNVPTYSPVKLVKYEAAAQGLMDGIHVVGVFYVSGINDELTCDTLRISPHRQPYGMSTVSTHAFSISGVTSIAVNTGGYNASNFDTDTYASSFIVLAGSSSREIYAMKGAITVPTYPSSSVTYSASSTALIANGYSTRGEAVAVSPGSAGTSCAIYCTADNKAMYARLSYPGALSVSSPPSLVSGSTMQLTLNGIITASEAYFGDINTMVGVIRQPGVAGDISVIQRYSTSSTSEFSIRSIAEDCAETADIGISSLSSTDYFLVNYLNTNSTTTVSTVRLDSHVPSILESAQFANVGKLLMSTGTRGNYIKVVGYLDGNSVMATTMSAIKGVAPVTQNELRALNKCLAGVTKTKCTTTAAGKVYVPEKGN